MILKYDTVQYVHSALEKPASESAVAARRPSHHIACTLGAIVPFALCPSDLPGEKGMERRAHGSQPAGANDEMGRPLMAG